MYHKLASSFSYSNVHCTGMQYTELMIFVCIYMYGMDIKLKDDFKFSQNIM